MSRRTKMNKSWAKKARGELKTKEWKNELQGYWGTKTTTSKAGIVYTNTVPWFKLQKQEPFIKLDMVAHLQRFFGNLF